MSQLLAAYKACDSRVNEIFYSNALNEENPTKVVMGHEHGFCCLDTATSSCVSCSSTHSRHLLSVLSCQFGSDKNTILFSQDQTVCLRDLRMKNSENLLELSHVVEHIEIDDSLQLVVADEDGCHSCIYDLTAKRILNKYDSLKNNDLGCIGVFCNNELFSKDTLYTSVFMNGAIRFYCKENGNIKEKTSNFIEHDFLNNLASNDFSPPLLNHVNIGRDYTSEDDLNLLIGSTASGHIILCESDFSREKWDIVHVWKAHSRNGVLFGCNLNLDSTTDLQLLTVGNDNCIKVWNFNWDSENESLRQTIPLETNVNHVNITNYDPHANTSMSHKILMSSCEKNTLFMYKICHLE